MHCTRTRREGEAVRDAGVGSTKGGEGQGGERLGTLSTRTDAGRDGWVGHQRWVDMSSSQSFKYCSPTAFPRLPCAFIGHTQHLETSCHDDTTKRCTLIPSTLFTLFLDLLRSFHVQIRYKDNWGAYAYPTSLHFFNNPSVRPWIRGAETSSRLRQHTVLLSSVAKAMQNAMTPICERIDSSAATDSTQVRVRSKLC
jgi:hypothetical protein